VGLDFQALLYHNDNEEQETQGKLTIIMVPRDPSTAYEKR